MNPLDASMFVAEPCKSLTDSQRQEFGLAPGEPDADASVPGESCHYDNDDAQISTDVTYNPELTTGLSHLYGQQAGGMWSVWEPTDVDGFPAVHYGDADIEAMGTCSFGVGLSDELFFRATVAANKGDDSCTAARNLATAVLDTIKAGG